MSLFHQVPVCPAHKELGLERAEELRDALALEGLDSRVTLWVLLPRRYGGGSGAGPDVQLPLGLCGWCQGSEDR